VWVLAIQKLRYGSFDESNWMNNVLFDHHHVHMSHIPRSRSRVLFIGILEDAMSIDLNFYHYAPCFFVVWRQANTLIKFVNSLDLSLCVRLNHSFMH